MSMNGSLLRVITTAAIVGAAPLVAFAQMPVTATFSILGDMTERIGGPHVTVTTIVGPDADTHVYQPTPADARAISDARVLIVNGLNFEGWLDRLTRATDFDGTRAVATRGIDPIALDGDDHGAHAGHAHAHAEGEHAHETEGAHHTEAAHASEGSNGGHRGGNHDHGAVDPHAWQSLDNALVYVDNITAALAQADPENATEYYQNRAAYIAEIAALDSEIDAMVAHVPATRRSVVTSHDAFQYFARAYGLTFLSPRGISTEADASAREVAGLIEQIRAQGIHAVFLENITDPRLLERIADETGATIGGTLYPDALSGPDGPAPSYLDMMRHNATTLTVALES